MTDDEWNYLKQLEQEGMKEALHSNLCPNKLKQAIKCLKEVK